MVTGEFFSLGSGERKDPFPAPTAHQKRSPERARKPGPGQSAQFPTLPVSVAEPLIMGHEFRTKILTPGMA